MARRSTVEGLALAPTPAAIFVDTFVSDREGARDVDGDVDGDVDDPPGLVFVLPVSTRAATPAVLGLRVVPMPLSDARTAMDAPEAPHADGFDGAPRPKAAVVVLGEDVVLPSEWLPGATCRLAAADVARGDVEEPPDGVGSFITRVPPEEASWDEVDAVAFFLAAALDNGIAAGDAPPPGRTNPPPPRVAGRSLSPSPSTTYRTLTSPTRVDNLSKGTL